MQSYIFYVNGRLFYLRLLFTIGKTMEKRAEKNEMKRKEMKTVAKRGRFTSSFYRTCRKCISHENHDDAQVSERERRMICCCRVFITLSHNYVNGWCWRRWRWKWFRRPVRLCNVHVNAFNDPRPTIFEAMHWNTDDRQPHVAAAMRKSERKQDGKKKRWNQVHFKWH